MVSAPTREDLIGQLQEIAARLGVRSVARTEYLRQSGVSERTILNHFDSWNAYVAAAGLEPDERGRRLDDDELFAAMLDAFEQGGGIRHAPAVPQTLSPLGVGLRQTLGALGERASTLPHLGRAERARVPVSGRSP